jgi:hypothetical protein
MIFVISLKHKSLPMTYLIKMERDEIFIAFPQKGMLTEKIFLTKNAHNWSGDIKDKKLVKKLGRKIEVILLQSAPVTK